MYLDKILRDHRTRIDNDTRNLSRLIDEASRCGFGREFTERIRVDSVDRLAVIAEIKRQSPSKGVLNKELDPSTLALSYEGGGASCLSVLTDTTYFGGSVSDFLAARAAVQLPVLRKDFTVSEKDICDAKIMGADCVLLIVAALDRAELVSFHQLADELMLDVLVETHSEAELELALAIGATLVGVNQRDLTTFAVDHDRAVKMAEIMPPNVIRVAESGVRNAQDAQRLRDAGYHAVLVGESLVTATDPVSSLEALRVRTG